MGVRPDRRRSRGTGVDVIAAKRKQERSPEGQHGQVVAPTEEAIRAAIEAAMCPFCGRGPYSLLALHTVQRHGVDRHELRRLAGLVKRASICSPEYSEKHRQLLVDRGGIAPKERPKKGRKIALSGAGRTVHRRTLKALAERPRTPAQMAASKANGAKRGKQLRKPRQSCTNCGAEVPFRPGRAAAKTCSPQCLSAVKSRNMSAARRSGRL